MDVEPVNFGIRAAVPSAYRLKVRAIGTAVLFEVVDGGEQEVVTAIGWAKLAPIVEWDWSERLKSADHPVGRMPAIPGEVNLSSHKRPAIRQAIRAVGARLIFLPPYSPDLNPIEQVFAKLEHMLRKAAKRTAENTWRRIGSLLDAFSPDECRNYLVNSGYASA